MNEIKNYPSSKIRLGNIIKEHSVIKKILEMGEIMSKTREVILPEYMSEFECIGSACEDTCCAGWGVTVDKATFKKYRNTKNPEIKDALKENVKRDRSSTSDHSYAKIKMDDTGTCTMLDEDHLCSIYKVLGPEFLSNTCTVYPRQLKWVDNVVENSATMSCPEAARLALLNEAGIEFKQDVEASSTKGFVNNNQMTGAQQKIFWELRIFTIRTVQNRSMTIENRLIIIGLFYKQFEELDVLNNPEKLPALIEKFDRNIQNQSLVASIEQLPSNISFQINMAKSLLEYRISAKISSQRYLDCFQEMVKGLGIDSKYKIADAVERYEDAYQTNYKPFMDHHSYIMENYLVNYVFSHLFPFDKKTVTDSFAMLIVNFSMIKLHLIGMAKYHGELDTDLVIKLIQSYSKTMDHNSEYLRNVENLLKDNGYSTLAHMVVLLKS